MRGLTLLVLAVLSSCSPPAARSLPATAPSPLLEKPSPEFTRTTLSGARVDTKELRGQPVVVKFFAEYCKPCKKTLPVAERLHRENPGVSFIGVSEDERASTAGSMVQTYGLSFPVVHDAGNVLAGRFRVGELPVTFVIDRTGRVRWVGGPSQTEQELEQAIGAIQ